MRQRVSVFSFLIRKFQSSEDYSTSDRRKLDMQAIQGTIAVNLCMYFLEHVLFLKQSGEFEILSWFISYKLFLSCQWPKIRIFYHKFA